MPKIICNGAQNKGFGADAVTTGMQIGEKKMPRYTDAEKLYERFAELEAQAMAQIEKLNKIPLEEMAIEEYIERRVWSAILAERSSFKFDVADAPTADVVEVVRCKDCKWFRIDRYGEFTELWCGHTEGLCIEENAFCSDGERKKEA